MKKVFQISLLVAALMAATAFSNEVVAQKIAVVDTEAILAASPQVKRAKSQLEALQKQYQKRLQAKYDKMQKRYADGVKAAQEKTLSKAQEAQLMQELQVLQDDITKSERSMQKTLYDKEQQLIEPILKKVRSTITEVAKSKGYRYVFNKNSMIYYPPGDDITKLVKAKLGYK